MAYKQVPDLDAKENDILDFLKDTASRKEFLVTKTSLVPVEDSFKYSGYNHETGELVMPGMRLHGAQHFIRAFHNPNSQIDRILIEWQTGSGKSICVISVAHEYIKQFREINAIGVKPPTVTVISFSVRETIQEDLLKYPEFGIVSHDEAENLKALKAKAGARNANIADSKTYSAHVGTLRRRITDAERGGYYRFFGYKEFANNLFKITAEGTAIGFDIQQLYRQDADNFEALLNVAVEKGYVVVDNELINSMRHGLMICDEIHDVYNISETNNYGIAIQYVLDKLGKTAPRAVFMSATPITGSAAEIIGLLNLLVPRHRLPGERPLKRSDFFTRSKYQEVDTFNYNGVTYSLKKFINIGKKQKVTNVKVNKLVFTPETINSGEPLAINIKNMLILVTGADIINHLISSKIDYTDIKVVPANAVESAEENDDIEAAELADLSSQFVISHLKEGAIEKISQLAAGRVSFLLDADVSAYPRRYFVGENIPDVPYLSITKCPMSEFHEKTIKQEHSSDGVSKPANSGFNAISYTLYDIAFPNPANVGYGLYLSSDTFNKIDSSPADWKTTKGIHINRRSDEIATISGEFLKMENLKTYSTKYHELIKAVLDVIKAGPGKIMIYHHRVRMSGVLLLQEAFKMNGFIDEFSNPVDSTICAICGLRRSEHFKLKSDTANVDFNIFSPTVHDNAPTVHNNVPTAHDNAPPAQDNDEFEHVSGYILPKSDLKKTAITKSDEKHEFTPARFVVAHSDVDRAAMFRSIGRYNSITNLQGYQYRLLIGSKIIRQGLNFKAVRHQFVASLPTDYPTLMQVFGRVVRKDSHADLPPSMRDVNIRVFVSTYANNSISPELQRYIDKGKEFIVIQRVEKALHEYAIDGFVNYDRIKDALGMKEEYVSSLNGMAYVPKVMRSSKVIDSTFLAYGYGDKEVSTIVAACRVLFKFRPVWTAKDLWTAVKAGLISKLYYDVDAMSEGNFTLALEVLKRPAGHPLTVIVNTGQYYIYSRVNPDGTPLIDVESYLREAPYNSSFSVEKKSTIKVSDFIKQARKGLEFTVKLREFDRKYLIEKETSIELSLVECNGDFHTELQRALISSNKKITSDDSRVIEMYKDFKICFTHEYMTNCKGSKLYRGSARTKPDKLVCYVSPEAAIVYDGEGKWYNMALADIGIHRRMVENDIVVGFTPNQISSSQIKDAESRYKIRPPLHKIKNTHTDNRLIIKGAICSSRPREELLKHISGLRKMLQTYRAQLNPLWNTKDIDGLESVKPISEPEPEHINQIDTAPAARLDLSYLKREDPASKERFPSGNILCRTLCTYLLGLEQISRNSKKVDSLRWMYLYCDKIPVVGAIGAGEEDINRSTIRPYIYDGSINALVYN